MMNKFLILGSNSFTGSHLISYLLENTEAEIIGISRSPEYSFQFLPYLYHKARSSRFHFYQFDINEHFNQICSICDVFKPDAVVNFSAQGEVRNSWKWPEQWYLTNCLSVVHLSEFLRTRDYLKRYIAVSTPEVYGATGENFKECHNYCPSTPYGASKLSGDLHLFALFKRYGFPVVFTRSANLYGIHQQLYRIIPRTIIYLKMHRIIELHGCGAACRAFIHAQDVADGTYKAIISGVNGEVYHLAPQGEIRSIAQTVHFICDEMGKNFQNSTKMIQENFGQDPLFSLDASKARNELNWNTCVSFETGVKETIAWINDNWEYILKQPMDYIHKK